MQLSSDRDKTKIHRLTLSFPDDLEKDFQRNYIPAGLLQVRIAIALGMLLYGLFGLLDAWIIPEAKLQLWFIRYICVIPCGLSVLIASYTRSFEKHMQPILASVVTLAGIGIVAMIVIAPPEVGQPYYAGLTLTITYGYTFLRLRFIWASMMGWVIVVSYEIAAIFLTHTAVLSLISNNFFFLGSNILLMFVCYSIEYHSRRDYLQTRMIESEKAKVMNGNRQLELRTQELEIARDRAESASRAKSEFLANMSHELRTPLNHILGFTELVADERMGELNQVQQEYLQHVLGSSRHLLSLINEVLDISKVEAGKMELESAEVNLQMLLDSSLAMVKAKAMKHGISLGVEHDGIPERIRADERKLRQVMYNLLSNALKFTPDGGEIRVTARLMDREAIVALCGKRVKNGVHAFSPLEQWLCVSVADTGIGIKEGDLERIFAPFEQADSSSSRIYDGTGLGLALSRSFVELHGGRIWAESEGAGRGSKFTFVIPSIQPEDRGSA